MSLLPLSLTSPARGQNGEVIDVSLQENQETSKEITQELLKEAAICLAAGLLGQGFTWLIATKRAYKVASLFQTLGYVARSKPSFVTRGLSQALPLVSAPAFATALSGLWEGYSLSETLFFEGWSSYKKYFEIFFWSALGSGASVALTPLLYKTPFLTQGARYVLRGFGAEVRAVNELNRVGKAISFLASPVASSLGYAFLGEDYNSMGNNIAQSGAFYLVLQGGLTLFSRLVLKTSASFVFKPEGKPFYLNGKRVVVDNKAFLDLNPSDQTSVVRQARTRSFITKLSPDARRNILKVFEASTNEEGNKLWEGLEGLKVSIGKLAKIPRQEQLDLVRETLVFHAGHNGSTVLEQNSMALLAKITAIVNAPNFIALVRNNFVLK